MTVFDFFTLTTYIDRQTPLFGQVDQDRDHIQAVSALRFLEDDRDVALVLQEGARPLTLEQAQTRLSQIGQKANLHLQIAGQAKPVLGFHQDEKGRIVIQ
ncbi:hypothetical protein LQZ24_01970 [Fructobacillus sp. M1-13]|uniref:Uncharacterized protein n=1 Tax=Fructobacillus papyriferae TaxID=2713171 RepID=A0ABS5QNW5_9LACO|nr:hypothetical protein [Fructobacillus papyriferae]MBS9334806.1 hypothetical protein [Fructobacillus papyriferae]MCD2158796.1 hypothetical protein [Fructobacillus papyriferae]